MSINECPIRIPFIKIILTNSWKVCWCSFPCQSNLLGNACKKLKCQVTGKSTVTGPLFTFRVIELYICNVLTDGNHVQTMRWLHYKHSWTSNSMLTFEFSSSRFNTCNIKQKMVKYQQKEPHSAQVSASVLTFAVSWHGPAVKNFAIRKYSSAIGTNAVTHNAYHRQFLTETIQVYTYILTCSHWSLVIWYTYIHNYVFIVLFTNNLMKIYYFSLNMFNKPTSEPILTTHFTSWAASLLYVQRGAQNHIDPLIQNLCRPNINGTIYVIYFPH